MVFAPIASVEIGMLAAPAFTVTGTPRAVPVPQVPSTNCTLPVIVPELAEVTVALSVAIWPSVEGFGLRASAVVVAALASLTKLAKR